MFEPKLDPYALAVYAAEFTLWSSIFGCGFYFNVLPRMHSGRAEPSLGIAMDVSPAHAEEEANANLDALTSSSSTSVFRTASGQTVRQRGPETHPG